jgi:uncharacterized protein (TIGR02001 family)
VRGVTLDVGYLHYLYPGDDYDGDSSEVYGIVSREAGPAVLKAGVYYSSNTPYAASSYYPFAEVRLRLPTRRPLTITGYVGRLDYRDGQAGPFQNYTHWSVSAATWLRGYDLTVGYFDTDIRHGAAPRLGRATAVATIGRSF